MQFEEPEYSTLATTRNTFNRTALASDFEETSTGGGLCGRRTAIHSALPQADKGAEYTGLPLPPKAGRPRFFMVDRIISRTKEKAFLNEDIEALAEIAALDVEHKLNKAFMAHGITAHPPVDLCMGVDGGIMVGAHPDHAKIEKLLREDTGLARYVRGAMALQEHAANFKQYSLFLDHYHHAYRKGGRKASEALYARFLTLAKPYFSYVFGVQGFITRVNGKALAEELSHTNEALSYA
jgi:hypothetical protein